MQVRAGDTAGGADGTDGLAPGHLLADGDIDAIQVGVHRDQTLAMVDKHRVAVEPAIEFLYRRIGTEKLMETAGLHA